MSFFVLFNSQNYNIFCIYANIFVSFMKKSPLFLHISKKCCTFAAEIDIKRKEKSMEVAAIPQKQVYLSIPQSDYRFITTLSRKMGWTIHRHRKNGLDVAIEDMAAGRVYHAKDGADLINQCL